VIIAPETVGRKQGGTIDVVEIGTMTDVSLIATEIIEPTTEDIVVAHLQTR